MTDAPLAEKILQRFVPVLFEDDDVLVVAKPSGVDLDPARDGSTTSMRELLAACTQADPEKLQPVNRLSRFESGVMVWAKRSTVAQAYRKSLRAGHWEFEYLAVVTGKLKQPKLRIAGVHGSSRGQRPHHGRKTARGAEPLRTSPTTIERLKFGPQRLLVRCETSADTTHALRAQLRAAGLRLVGDHLGKGQEQRPETANTCLHLQRIRYTREGQNQHYVSRVAAPSDFDDAVSGNATIERHLATSLLRRLPCLLDEETTAHGLLLGDEEQVPGLQAELLDSVIVLRVMERRADDEVLVKRVGRWYRKTLGASSVYVKRIVKTTSKQAAGFEVDHQHAGALLGPPAEEELVVREHGTRFAVRPYDGVAVGLYFDQRENRARVRSAAAGREVLNLRHPLRGFRSWETSPTPGSAALHPGLHSVTRCAG
jgi:23S rRNA-/tRNA-specific pseudouridylate synthase